MAGSTRWECTHHECNHGQHDEQHRRKGSIATVATRHDVSPPSARETERTSLVKANLLATNDWTRSSHPPAAVTGLETEAWLCEIKHGRPSTSNNAAIVLLDPWRLLSLHVVHRHQPCSLPLRHGPVEPRPAPPGVPRRPAGQDEVLVLAHRR
jgi:hypothetical protein